MFERFLPSLFTARLQVHHARPGNEVATVNFFERNRAHLARWDPPPPGNYLTTDYWARSLERAVDDFQTDRAVRFDLWDVADHEHAHLIGRIGFSQIMRGPFQACFLGYQIDAAKEGMGLMTEALRTAIPYMFQTKAVHRIQANHLPENVRSERVLRRLGFEREGLARQYLFVAGAWRDHVLNALTNPDFQSDVFPADDALD